MPKPWFAAKRYGYGWHPVTWQGWSVMVGYLFLLLAPSVAVSVAGIGDRVETAFVWMFIGYVFVLTCVLLCVCFKKGEPARWRWCEK